MKIKFDGRIYDTHNATLLSASNNGLHILDDHYEEIRLYVKNNGEYFLYCRGGSKSEWSICKNNKVLSGQYIIPSMNPKFEEWVTFNAMLIDSMMHLSGVK